MINVRMSTERLEEAEKRRLERLQQKVEIFKTKNDKWTKKVEKIKLDEEKKLRDKGNACQPVTSSSNIFRNLAQRMFGRAESKLVAGDRRNPQPELFGSSKMCNYGLSKLPPVAIHDFQALPNNPFSKYEAGALPTPVAKDLDDFDIVEEGQLDSFDITAYEEYDEELKHRIGKTYPGWASNNGKLKIAIFSMILMSEFEKKLPSGFPAPDRKFKVFPNAK